VRDKTREILRWVYLICYIGLSVSIYISHLIQTNTPLALIIYIFLNGLILVAFKLNEKKNEKYNTEKEIIL